MIIPSCLRSTGAQANRWHHHYQHLAFMLYLISRLYMLLYICSIMNHRWHWNVVRTKKWHTRSSWVCHWCKQQCSTNNTNYNSIWTQVFLPSFPATFNKFQGLPSWWRRKLKVTFWLFRERKKCKPTFTGSIGKSTEHKHNSSQKRTALCILILKKYIERSLQIVYKLTISGFNAIKIFNPEQF